MKEHGRLFEGIREMLATLAKDGHEMVICGMGSKEYIETVLEHCAITGYFKAVYHRIEGLSKTQVVKTILSDMNLDSNQCLMVGDSITDITAAKDNDIPFIGVSYGYGADDISDADALVDSVEQLQAEIYRHIVFTRIEKDIQSFERPIVIGVNGVDTSGKTVFSLSLCNYLQRRGIPTTLIHTDDFHNPRSIRYTDASPRGYLNYAFDLDKLAALIRELKQNPASITLSLLDLDADTYSNEILFESNENTIIIIEGVLLYRQPIDELIDYRVFLDVGFDEVISRAQRRDVPKHGESFLQRYMERYIPAQQIYLNDYTPKERCDIVVDNSDYLKPVISI